MRSVEIVTNQPKVRARCAREEWRETHRDDQSWIILEAIVKLPDELLLVLLWGCTKGRLAKVGRWRVPECRLRVRKGKARSAERRRESSRTVVQTSESVLDGCRVGSLELSEGPARRWYESKGKWTSSACAQREIPEDSGRWAGAHTLGRPSTPSGLGPRDTSESRIKVGRGRRVRVEGCAGELEGLGRERSEIGPHGPTEGEGESATTRGRTSDERAEEENLCGTGTVFCCC